MSFERLAHGVDPQGDAKDAVRQATAQFGRAGWECDDDGARKLRDVSKIGLRDRFDQVAQALDNLRSNDLAHSWLRLTEQDALISTRPNAMFQPLQPLLGRIAVRLGRLEKRGEQVV